jgi:site-specific DNA-methyltransferase (adenine-specific)
MKDIPDKFYDLAVVDPPYGIGAGGSFGHYWDSTKGKSANIGVRNTKKSWDHETPSLDYFIELFRVSKNQIIWGGNYFTDKLPISRCWVCYDKKQPENNSFGKFELAWTSFDKISLKFEFYPTHVTQGTRIHPTQKPVKLYEWLLMNYAKEGDKILDTHGGSQSSRIACYNLGYELDIIELDQEYFDQGNKRFEEHKQQLRLF